MKRKYKLLRQRSALYSACRTHEFVSHHPRLEPQNANVEFDQQ